MTSAVQEPQDTTAPRGKSTRLRWKRVFKRLRPFVGPHRPALIKGSIFSLGVVLLRLALPWPLRTVLKPWLMGDDKVTSPVLQYLPDGISPLVAMGVVLLLLMSLLGLADHLARLSFARFAIGFVRDIRAAAFRSVARAREVRPDRLHSGDLVARLIGDTARIKAGTKGFLIHVATNGVMYVGITVILLLLDPLIGAVFAAGGVLVAATTVWGAVIMFNRALRFRKKEGKLANRIDNVWKSGADPTTLKINKESGRHEASLTRIQGRFTWLAHSVLGALILASGVFGSAAVRAGRIAPDELFVILVYALMLRAPIVQLARQGVRTGKILACAHRVVRLLKSGKRLKKPATATAAALPTEQRAVEKS